MPGRFDGGEDACAGAGVLRSEIRLMAQSVAGALDLNHDSMMRESIKEHSRAHGITEDSIPFCEDPVCLDPNGRTALPFSKLKGRPRTRRFPQPSQGYVAFIHIGEVFPLPSGAAFDSHSATGTYPAQAKATGCFCSGGVRRRRIRDICR